MNFRPDLADAVMAGEKTVTRRLTSQNRNSPWWTGQCALKVGRDYAVCPGRSKHALGRVEILSVRHELLGHLNDTEAQAEGFPDAQAFEDAFAAINGSYDPAAVVWRVEFRLVEYGRNGRPATKATASAAKRGGRSAQNDQEADRG